MSLDLQQTPAASATGEFRALTRLAAPLLITQIAQMLNGVADTIMAGRYSPADLAGVAVGGAIWGPMFLFSIGVLNAVSALVSQDHGAGRKHLALDHLMQAIWLSVFLGSIAIVVLANPSVLFDLMNTQQEVSLVASGYMQALIPGAIPVLIFVALRQFNEGLSNPRPAMIITMFSTLLNVGLNYVFIYGKFGFPELGGVGCGWATSIATSIQLILMVLWTHKKPAFSELSPFKALAWPHLQKLRDVWRVGYPIGVSLFLESSMFAIIALLLSDLPAATVAGHQIALNFTSLAFMIPLSLGMAMTVRVGFNIGSRSAAGLQRAVRIGWSVGALVGLTNAVLLFVFRDVIASIYTTDSQTHQVAVVLIGLAALFQVVDALQVTESCILRGMKDTKITMLSSIIAFWIVGIPLGYILGKTDWLVPSMGAPGFWIGLSAGLTVAAAILGARVLTQVRHMRERLAPSAI